MKIETLQPGMRVWSVEKYTVGNTTMKSVGVYPVKIISVDVGCKTVIASWNGNRDRTFGRRSWSKWKKERPMLVKLGFNQYRLANRGERIELNQRKDGECSCCGGVHQNHACAP